MPKKLSLEFVQEQVRKVGHEPLFDEYKDSNQRLKCRCKVHGIFYVRYLNIYNAINRNNGANGCKKCGLENKRHSVEYVKKCFIEKGFTPLFEQYSKIREKLPYICNNHPELGVQEASLFKVINQYSPCKQCSHENRLIYTEQQVRDMIISKGFIPRFEKFVNTKQKFKIECPKHGIFITNFQVIKNYNPCKKCANERQIKPIEFRATQDNEARGCIFYKEWKKRILSRDNYKCQKCGNNKNLKAHHILNFKTHVELRFEDSNGIILCEDCHKKFHSIYGNKINNKEQLIEFLGENK